MSSNLSRINRSFYTRPPRITSLSPLEEEESILKADKIEVIPQYGATAWFNAILTALLYSQGLRQFVYKKALEWQSNNPEELKRNKFKQLLMYILKYNYTQPRKIVELFKKKVKPELLLLSYLDYYHSEDIDVSIPFEERTLEELIQHSINEVKLQLKSFNYDNDFIFIYYLFRSLFEEEKDFLEIFFKYNNIYINVSPPLNQSVNPEVLLLLHDDFINILIDPETKEPVDIKHKGISNYRETISFNGSTYKLDCCLATNFDFLERDFINPITGLTYDNKGFVYNSWTGQTINKLFGEYRKNHKSSYMLFPRNWKKDLHSPEGTARFCLAKNKSKILEGPLEQGDACYDFSLKKTENKKNKKILIYVKVGDYGSLKVSSETTDYSSMTVERLAHKFHQFGIKNLDKLFTIAVTKVSYNKEQLEAVIDNLLNYKTLFFILCKRRHTELVGDNRQPQMDEINKKNFLSALIELYLKNGVILDFSGLNDTDILKGNLRSSTLQKAVLSIKGYELLKDPSKVNDYLLLIHMLHFHFNQGISNEIPDNVGLLYFHLLSLLLQAYINDKGDIYETYDLELFNDVNIIAELIKYKSHSQKLALSNRSEITDYQINLLKEKINKYFSSEITVSPIADLLRILTKLTIEDVIYLFAIKEQMSSEIRPTGNMLHDFLGNKTNAELFNLIVETYQMYSNNDLIAFIRNLNDYSILFFILCGKRIEDGNEETNIRAILIALINFYFKHERKLELRDVNNNAIRDEYIDNDKIKQSIEQLGYSLTYTTPHIWLILHNCLLNARREPYRLRNNLTDEEIMKNFMFNLLEAYVLASQSYNLVNYTDNNILQKIKNKTNGMSLHSLIELFKPFTNNMLTTRMSERLFSLINEMRANHSELLKSSISRLSLQKLRELIKPVLKPLPNRIIGGKVFKIKRLKSYK